MTQYYDVNYALPVANLLKNATTQTATNQNSDRRWVSQPRSMQDDTWEILTLTFSSPASISEISVDISRINSTFEFWYTNRAGVRLQVNDRSLRQFSGKISSGASDSFVSLKRLIYPVVAVSLELRLQRQYDPSDSNSTNLQSFQVRNLLTKRNIYQIEDALQPFEKDIDSLGNLVERSVRSWSPNRAVDSSSSTFWKSSPQPTPDAVVSFFMDVRDLDGAAQQIDRFSLDPVYTGQQMNLYYSTDDSVKNRKLSSEKAIPVSSTNVTWDRDLGINLTSPTADYEIEVSSYAHRADQSWWIALTWTPDFDSNSAPASDRNLLANNSGTFSLKYLVGSNTYRVTYNGNNYNVSAPTAFERGDNLGIVVRVIRSGDLSGLTQGIYMHSLINDVESFRRIPAGDTLTDLALNDSLSFGSYSGWLSNFILKQSSPREEDYQLWAQDPAYYLTPDPVLEDDDPNTPIANTTLDNVLLGNDLRIFENLRGGLDQYFFAEKIWSPVWANWLVYKGFYYLPTPVYAKYLKFEFTQLTQEPYPVYESGIQVQYKTFPISLDTINTDVSTKTQVTTTTSSSTNVISGANKGKTSQSSFSSTEEFFSSSTYTDYQVTLGSGTVSYNIPYLLTNPYTNFGTEIASSVTSRLNSFTNKTDKVTSVTTQMIGNDNKTSLALIAQAFNVTKNSLLIANNLLKSSSSSTIPKSQIAAVAPVVDKSGYFVLPKIGGVAVRIPSTTVTNHSTSSTSTYYTTTSTSRTRFTNSEVHRYESKTATRDMAIAYFAGMREISIYRVRYNTADDTEVYSFLRYDNDHFVRSSEIVTDESGFSHTTAVGQTGTITSVTLPSATSFQKISIVPIERGLRSNKGPVSLLQSYDTAGAAWEDRYATWEDPAAPWDADIPAARAEFDSNYSFQGQTVVELSRSDAFGLAGVVAPPYHLLANSRYRMGFTIFRAKPGDNVYRLQLVDGDTGNLIKEFNPTPDSGKWVTFTTDFQTLGNVTYSPSVGSLMGPQDTVWTGSPAYQQFVPSGSTTVHGVRLRTTNTGGLGTVTVSITDTSDVVLASGTFDYSKTSGEIDVPLSSSLALAASTPYRIRITWTGQAAFWTTNTVTNSQIGTTSGINNNSGNPRMLFTLLGAPVASSASDYPNAVVRLLTEGSAPETIFISGLWLEETTTTYELSNNSGTNYYEVTSALYNESSYFNFPSFGNQLRIRITVRQPGDLIAGLLLTPSYV